MQVPLTKPNQVFFIGLSHTRAGRKWRALFLSDQRIDQRQNGPGVGAPRPPNLWGGFSLEWGALGLGFRGVKNNLGLPPEARLR
jgi:hypothetical protein